MPAKPYMRWWIGDYLADTRHLTTLQHGAYTLLICAYWRRGGPLPDDDAKLARHAGLGPREWARHRDTLSELFQVANGAWLHRRIEAELSHADAKSLRSKAGGHAKAAAKQCQKPAISEVISQKSVGSSEPTISDANASSPRPEAGAEGLPLFGGEGEAPLGPEPEARYSKHFKAFYDAYPRHTGPAAAAKSYERAVDVLTGKKPGNAPRAHSKLKAAAEAYAVLSAKIDRDKVPHPATWLNQGRYDDDDIKQYLERQRSGNLAPGEKPVDWKNLGRPR